MELLENMHKLSNAIYKKILSFFQNEKNGLNKEQFFAMLRLIAHAQNGRSVIRDLVHLGGIEKICRKMQVKLSTNHPFYY